MSLSIINFSVDDVNEWKMNNFLFINPFPAISLVRLSISIFLKSISNCSLFIVKCSDGDPAVTKAWASGDRCQKVIGIDNKLIIDINHLGDFRKDLFERIICKK